MYYIILWKFPYCIIRYLSLSLTIITIISLNAGHCEKTRFFHSGSCLWNFLPSKNLKAISIAIFCLP